MSAVDASRLRTAAAILEAAAHLFAERGASVSMADVAAAAGVGRATLYRHYANRDALLQALLGEALQDAGARIADAGLDGVPADEGIVRIIRAIVAAGDRYAVLILAREGVRPEMGDVDRRIAEPIRRVLDRGIEEGVLRDDLPPGVLGAAFGGAVRAAVELAGERHLGIEDVVAAVSRAFLDGARPPAEA